MKRKHYDKRAGAAADRAAEARELGARRQASASSSSSKGRDGAGKGGTITRFTQHLNPRQARVVALSKPSDTEKRAMVFPALCRADAHSRRDRLLRPLLVQPRRRRARDGFLHAGADRRLPERGAGLRGHAGARRHPADQVLPHHRPARCRCCGCMPAGTTRSSAGSSRRSISRRSRASMPIRTPSTRCWPADVEMGALDVIRGNDKLRARLNAIRHVLLAIPYKDRTRRRSASSTARSCCMRRII